MSTEGLDKLFSDVLSQQDESRRSLPPVHLWNPELSGDMDLIIDRDGRWIHEGGEIKLANSLIIIFCYFAKRYIHLFSLVYHFLLYIELSNAC